MATADDPEAFTLELQALAWIGPADASTVAEQFGARTESETTQRLDAAAAASLVRKESNGAYALTDEGYAVLRSAIDGES